MELLLWVLFTTAPSADALDLDKMFPKVEIRFSCGVSEKEIAQAEKFFAANCDDYLTSLPTKINNCNSKTEKYVKYTFTSRVCELRWTQACTLKKDVPFSAEQICIRPRYNPFSFSLKTYSDEEKQDLKRSLEGAGCSGIDFKKTGELEGHTDIGLVSDNCVVWKIGDCDMHSVKVPLHLSQKIKAQLYPTPHDDDKFYVCRFKATTQQKPTEPAKKDSKK